MTTADELKKIVTLARPLVEQWLDLSEEFAAIRDAATEKGLDWSQIKALLKAQMQDERDGGDGKRVKRIVEKADYASSYAGLLGFAKMNENNFVSEQPTPADDSGIPPFLDRRHKAA